MKVISMAILFVVVLQGLSLSCSRFIPHCLSTEVQSTSRSFNRHTFLHQQGVDDTYVRLKKQLVRARRLAKDFHVQRSRIAKELAESNSAPKVTTLS
jgi:hypothetical protein